jgi:exodeoxyribonuclease III
MTGAGVAYFNCHPGEGQDPGPNIIMLFLSWNVNGLRAVLRKEYLLEFLAEKNPDILALQEIKISEAKLAKENLAFPGYKFLTNGARREGYSGTAILVKEKLFKSISKINNGIGLDHFDHEGRIQILEFPKFYFLNVYFPNSRHDLSRLKYKEDFNSAMLKYLKKVRKKKPVIITGDFNVAHEDMDLARPKDNIGNPGFTFEERRDMDRFVESGLLDTFRLLHPKKVQYSWWSHRAGARRRNIGWRIDYFLVSDKMRKHLKSAFILDEQLGSDHAPVGMQFKD